MSAAASEPPAHTSFYNPNIPWANLNEVGVLNYFKGSPFYSTSCNNEKLRVNEGAEALAALQGASSRPLSPLRSTLPLTLSPVLQAPNMLSTSPSPHLRKWYGRRGC